jgi:hypothetical protein
MHKSAVAANDALELLFLFDEAQNLQLDKIDYIFILDY